jgi:rare lipoprotein A
MALVALIAITPAVADQPWTEEGIASWYGPGFAGRPTASTEIYDPDLLTAAHKTLPLGSLVRVYNLENDRNMIVRINDRGPFIDGRVIDLSRACAEVLECKDTGLARVRLVLLTDPNKPNVFARNVTQQIVTQEIVTQEIVTQEIDARTPDDWPADVPAASEPLTPGYYVQVGAFAYSENAQNLVQQADELGMPAYVEVSGGQHRVLVGPYISFATASSAQRDLQRAGIDGFLRVSNR